jgi:hypothetical protein
VTVDSHGDEDVGWGKPLTRPLQLSGNPESRDIWERVGEIGEGVRISRVRLYLMRKRIVNMQ